jgi:hypothetical protein
MIVSPPLNVNSQGQQAARIPCPPPPTFPQGSGALRTNDYLTKHNCEDREGFESSIRFLTPFPPHFSQRSLNSHLNLFPIRMFVFDHHALSSILVSSNIRDRPDSPGPCEKCFGKAEPSKSLSLSLPYLSVSFSAS